MKKINLIAMTAVGLFAACTAQAQSGSNYGNGYFAEIGYSQPKLSGAGGDSKPDAVRFLIGNEISKHLDVEGVYMSTVSKDSQLGYKASISSFGVLLKPKVELTQDTLVFARMGVIRADITASTSGSHTGTDLAYGLGIQTMFSKTVYGQLDYLNQYDRSGHTAKGYTLSLGTRF